MNRSKLTAVVVSGLGTLIMSSVMAVIAPTTLPAEELHCMECAELPGIWGPAGFPDQHVFATGGGELMDCHAFNACHTNAQDGHCQEWHYFCQSGPHALQQVKAAAKAGALASILQLASQENSLVDISGDGYAVVWDCARRTVIGAITLPPSEGQILVYGFVVVPSDHQRDDLRFLRT